MNSIVCFIYMFNIPGIKKGKAAGPESWEDYFQKGALFGQKAALNLWYVDTRSSKFLQIWPGIDVPLFEPKVHLFENSLLKVLALEG